MTQFCFFLLKLKSPVCCVYCTTGRSNEIEYNFKMNDIHILYVGFPHIIMYYYEPLRQCVIYSWKTYQFHFQIHSHIHTYTNTYQIWYPTRHSTMQSKKLLSNKLSNDWLNQVVKVYTFFLMYTTELNIVVSKLIIQETRTNRKVRGFGLIFISSISHINVTHFNDSVFLCHTDCVQFRYVFYMRPFTIIYFSISWEAHLWMLYNNIHCKLQIWLNSMDFSINNHGNNKIVEHS